VSAKAGEAASDPKRQLLRHCVATLAYRAAKALRDVPDGFAALRVSSTTRTSGEIVAHMGDLLEWALSIAKNEQAWRDSKPLAWTAEVQRFFAALAAFDAYLASHRRCFHPRGADRHTARPGRRPGARRELLSRRHRRRPCRP